MRAFGLSSKLDQELRELEYDAKLPIINKLVRERDLSVRDVGRKMRGLSENADKFSLAKAWLYKRERSVEDLTSVLGFFNRPEYLKHKLVKSWLNKGDAEDLTPVLNLFSVEEYRSALFATG